MVIIGRYDMNRFGHLHTHSEFSLLDGEQQIKKMIDKAKAMGQDFIAITDHGTMYGLVKANKYAKEVGIKHIVGCELYTTPWGRDMKDRDYAKGEKSNGHLIVLAKNKVGYKNLCRLCSIAYRDGYYYKPRVDHKTLQQYKEGLIITSACMASSVNRSIADGNIDKAREEMLWFKEQFGDDYYVELQKHFIPEEDMVMEVIKDLAAELGIKTTVGIDSHYLNKDDEQAHDALLCIGTGQKVDDEPRRFKFNGSGYWLMTQQEVEKLFPNDLDAVYRTAEIADKCDVDIIEYGDLKIPYFDVEEAIKENYSEEAEAFEEFKKGEFKKWLI